MKVLLGYLALIVFVLGIANFVVFAMTGDAAVPIDVSHPLAMVAGGYLGFAFIIPTMLGRQTARALPPAGPPGATFRTGGRLGRMSFSGKLIKVTVYADRLTLKPLFLAEYTIHGSEIQSIADQGGIFRGLRIEHRGPGLFSRVTLHSVPEPVRAQIHHISRDPLPAGRRPTPDALAARATGRRFTSVFFVVGVAVGVGLVAFGITQYARYDSPFLLVWTAGAATATVVVAREFVKFRRRV